MKKHLLRFSIIAVVAFCSFNGLGQSFSGTYNFANFASTTTGRVDPTPPPVSTGISFGSFSASTTVSALSTAGGRFSFTGWPLGATNGMDVFTGALDATKYYQVTLTPQTYYTFDLDSVTFTLQRSGTGIRQYAVRSSIDGYTANLAATVDPVNASLQVVGGNTFQVTDASTTANDGSKIILTGVSFTDIAIPITFRFYGWNSEATAGSFSIDNVKFSGNANLSPTAPNLVLSNTSLIFPVTAINSSSTLSYTIKGANLTDPVVITTTAPYSVSDAVNGTYTTSLTIATADVASDKSIFVKFSPLTAATFADTVTNTSTNASTKIIVISGDGVDPDNLVFNFDNCATLGVPGSGFTPYSVTGAQKWACSSFGLNTTKGVDINGYSGGAQENEDWLISPPLNVSSLDLPVLRFWSKGEFTGPSLQLLASTNYDGISDPNTATWTDLQANFPALNATWTMTDGIDLSAYKGSPVYIAFKYLSSEELGAARWTIDDVDVTNRTQLLSTYPSLLNFDEVASGSHSNGLQFSVKAVGYGDVTLTPPSGYELSTDNITYSASIVITAATLSSGTNIFVRFSPTVNALTISGLINFKAPGLDSNLVTLTGSSYPKSETFDAGCYNLSFFGSNATNNPTQAKIDLQVDNIAIVMNKLNMDVLGVEEVSNDDALTSLVEKLNHRSAVISNRWSYSFNPPDPTFPPQKTGFIYDNTTTTLVSSRDMFVDLYDKARTTNPELLPNYPGGNPQSFWASGRLPFMATFDVTIGGTTKRIVMIDIHAKSASDVASYNRRVYDAKVLKDSLDAYYANDNVVIVGDYNDRVTGSIYAGSTVSPYQPFVADNANYSVLTLPLDQAGRVSFLTGSGLIDQITVSNKMVPFYISNSTDIEDPRSYISNYNATTASDHMPVYSRFNFSAPLPVTLVNFNAQPKGKQVLVTWTTSAEYHSNYFVVERSADARTFISVGAIKSVGNNLGANYQLTDSLPLSGINYYRLKQVDRDGTVKYSLIVAVSFGAGAKNALVLYPNPVANHIQLNLNSAARNYVGKVTASDGRVLLNTNGDIMQINQQINQNLYKFKSGVYVLKISNATDEYSVKFIKQ
ncbi:MAG: choice-of-anchor J domain-containing protein [Ginsengibacter sp.]